MVSNKHAGKGLGRKIATVGMGVALTVTMVGMPAGTALAKSSSSNTGSSVKVAVAKKAAKNKAKVKRASKKKSSAKKRSSQKKGSVTARTAAMNAGADNLVSTFARPSEGIEMDGPVLGAVAAKVAKQYVGYTYVYGGASPATGFDCSGLTQYAYKQAGVSIWRTAQDQYSYCKKKSKNVVAKDDIVPGDLLFFGSSKRSISHVGIYLGNGKFVHAVKPGSGVKVTKLAKRTNWVAAGRPYKD